jgi:hypothetical protein
MIKILNPALVLLSSSVASHSCTFGNSTELVEVSAKTSPQRRVLLSEIPIPLSFRKGGVVFTNKMNHVGGEV